MHPNDHIYLPVSTKSPELTERMGQVLKGIAAGQTNNDIGTTLGISAKTVEKHRQLLYKAFAVNNAVSLVITALRQKVISL